MVLTKDRVPTKRAPPEQPPVEEKTGFRWFWLGAALIVVVIAAAATWALLASDDTPVASEYDHEVTALKIAAPGITAVFVGTDANLDPDIILSEYDHEVTALKIAEPGVIAVFVGESGELDADK